MLNTSSENTYGLLRKWIKLPENQKGHVAIQHLCRTYTLFQSLVKKTVPNCVGSYSSLIFNMEQIGFIITGKFSLENKNIDHNNLPTSKSVLFFLRKLAQVTIYRQPLHHLLAQQPTTSLHLTLQGMSNFNCSMIKMFFCNRQTVFLLSTISPKMFCN